MTFPDRFIYRARRAAALSMMALISFIGLGAWGIVAVYSGSPGWAVIFFAAAVLALFISITQGRQASRCASIAAEFERIERMCIRSITRL